MEDDPQGGAQAQAAELNPSPARQAATTRLFLRLLGLVYITAFASLALQVEGLVGSRGIVPASEFLSWARSQTGAERYWLRADALLAGRERRGASARELGRGRPGGPARLSASHPLPFWRCSGPAISRSSASGRSSSAISGTRCCSRPASSRSSWRRWRSRLRARTGAAAGSVSGCCAGCCSG